jgi:hypothetical protein
MRLALLDGIQDLRDVGHKPRVYRPSAGHADEKGAPIKGTKETALGAEEAPAR